MGREYRICDSQSSFRLRESTVITHVVDFAFGDQAEMDDLPYLRHGRRDQRPYPTGSFDLQPDPLGSLVCCGIVNIEPGHTEVQNRDEPTLDMRTELHPPLLRRARHALTIFFEPRTVDDKCRSPEA